MAVNENGHLGFREVIPDQSALVQWRNITIDTGAAQSTLQDIKVPEYGGGYAYKSTCPATRNRYLFWRVCHDIVELWEESLDYDFTLNHVQFRFADTPVLEGLSVHETRQYVYILLATVSSVHRIRLPHPQQTQNIKSKPYSILSELTFQTLKEYHNLHILNSNLAGEGLPHTAATHLLSGDSGNAVFILGQTGGTLLVVKMYDMPFSVFTETIKNASLMNRLFTGFVPGMFRGMEGAETVTSLVVHELGGDVIAMGVCRDGKMRAWSCSKLQCMLVHDILENTAEAGRKLNPGAQRHQIRSCTHGEEFTLGVYLNFNEKQLILIYQPSINNGQLILKHIKTVYPPQFDLVDFSLTTSYIWTLWTDASNDTQLLYASVDGEGEVKAPFDLSAVVLEQPPDKDVPLTDPYLDPKEVYLRELFTPNRFSAYTLRKALGIYRRSVEMSFVGDRDMWRLQEEVEAALREQVEARLNSDLSEEEIAQITMEAWATFYSHTLQYHQVGHKPVGIVGIGADRIIGIVRKQVVSWIRPMDALEILSLAPIESLNVTSLNGVLSEDTVVTAAVIALARPLRKIREILPPEVAAAFLLDLHHLQSPDQVGDSITASLLADSSNLGASLSQQLAGVTGIVGGLWGYLHALQLDMGMPDSLVLENGGLPPPQSVSEAFRGCAGASVISAVVAQMARVRLELCRDLLLLQQVALQLGHQCRLTTDSVAQMRSTLLPKTSLLTQAYFALLHISTAPAIQASQATLDVGKRQLAALSLSEGPGIVLSPSGLGRPTAVLELFFMNSGGDYARSLAMPTITQSDANNSGADGEWSELLMPLSVTVSQLAWPISRCLLLVEWLVWGGQHGAVQEYVRLLQPWCEWNSCSRKFLLGVALLNQGEAAKAARLFMAAQDGIMTEDFLAIKVAGGGADTPPDQLRVMYCLRVIRLLEQSGHPDLALQVAQEGVSIASADHPSLSALYLVVFKHHLELQHHDEAFTALSSFPDPHRRRNCLRQLIISLHDRKCLKTLVNYQYGSLELDVVTILENRARSADILVNNYYDLLYAFHIRKHNYKKGACVMYECALRLNVEGLGEKGLRQQAKCYLACLNCLRHIPSEQAWILKPLPKASGESDDGSEKGSNGNGSKRSASGTSVIPPLCRKKPQVKVLELKHIEREYELVHARLKMLKLQPDSQAAGGPLSADDTISLLTHGRLFREAVRLAKLFDLSIVPIFQELANACLHPQPSQAHILREANGIVKEGDENEVWWNLLKDLLEEEEQGNQSLLHRTVCSVLLQHTTALPTWLVNSYKLCNCGELLHLYVNHGLLEDGVRLACQYVDGILGHGTDQVGLCNALHSREAPVWMPYTALDKLLLELQEVQQNKYFAELSRELNEKLQIYHTQLQKVSQDRVILLQG
ncbi:nuclear pore complex protein Nup160 [Macrobrachium rosenbergii]|uniref:nuclear pore complex protein Nup160 n=1 Tax=Macrobrachium rosenbergii TaxID=79674 RepID=UPI0034D7041A